MIGPILVVLVIAHGTNESLAVAFEQTTRDALGARTQLEMREVAEAPSDGEGISLAGSAEGLIELSWESGGAKAKLHCYVSREQRWIDREIDFGNDGAHGERETAERGRLLGFAVATMFGEQEHPASPAPPTLPPRGAPINDIGAASSASRVSAPTRSFEFSGDVSSGIAGTASGVGAAAGVRLRLTGPIWGRVFFAGRVGNIAQAQATTGNASFGGGLALALLPAENRLALGLRVDAFANYFETIHFSEDDIVPDKRSRWLPGADLVAEGGLRLVGAAAVSLGLGLEAVLGKTAIYTHQRQVAQVAPVRAVAELGFRVGF